MNWITTRWELDHLKVQIWTKFRTFDPRIKLGKGWAKSLIELYQFSLRPNLDIPGKLIFDGLVGGRASKNTEIK